MKEAKKLRKKLVLSIKNEYFCKVTGKDFANNNDFWNTAKPFLTNKGFLTNEIAIENKVKIVSDKCKLVSLFNSHCINTAEKMPFCPPEIEVNPENKTNGKATMQSIIRKYQRHPSVLNIKSTNTAKNTFDIPAATSRQISRIIKELNAKTTKGPDKNPTKISQIVC